jgi:biotin transport system substrate-specific component
MYHRTSTTSAENVFSSVLILPSRLTAGIYNITLVAGASLAIALSAQVYFPLPFSPVPVTGQTMTVLLVGALLGRKRGVLAVATYLILGTTGLPLFSAGGFGITRLLGPTGGYLVGFLAAAYLTGWLAEAGWDRRIYTSVVAMIAGNVVIYVLGLARLAHFTDWDRVLPLGLYPFIAGDVLKILLASTLLPAGWKLLGKPASRNEN